MDVDVIVALIVLVQAIGVAVINNRMKRRDESNDKYREEREEKERERKKLDVAILDLAFANAKANEVLLHKAHGDQVNGNVDSALQQIQQAESRCSSIVNKVAIG